MRSPLARRVAALAAPWIPLVALVTCGAPSSAPPRPPARAAGGAQRDETLTVLSSPGREPSNGAEAGDLLLVAGPHARLAVKAIADRDGHAPLRGAIVDAWAIAPPASDPLLFWRPAWRKADGTLVAVAGTSAPTRCADGRDGVAMTAAAEGVRLTSVLCAQGEDRFVLRTEADGLEGVGTLADTVSLGASPIVLDEAGVHWTGSRRTRALASAAHGTALAWELGDVEARRELITIAKESFPVPVTVTYASARAVERTLRVSPGDLLDAVGQVHERELALTVGVAHAHGGRVELLGEDGAVLASGRLDPGRARALRLPQAWSRALRVRDGDGVVVFEGNRAELAARADRERLPSPAGAAVDVKVVAVDGAPLAAHVILRGVGATPTPDLRVLDLATDREELPITAGSSVYAPSGSAHLVVPPGEYELLATHGPLFGLHRRTLTLRAGESVREDVRLAREVDSDGWISADLHLHAAPSPDAPVSLRERVASLACEGVDLAVATDHNRLTSYEPARRSLGLAKPDTWTGVEITSAGAGRWGHFNAFPLPLGAGSPEASTPAYFDVPPTRMFAEARALGASIIQVNHPRMAPKLGYFDLAGLDVATGTSAEPLADDFDAVEVFNGLWMEEPERVRADVRDVVALARRGKRVTMTGNSDSHRLLFQEAGYPRTYLKARDASGAVEALRRGLAVATSGPLVTLEACGEDGRRTVRPGADGFVELTLRVRAASWIAAEDVEIWLDDAVHARLHLERRRGAPMDTTKTLRVPVRHDATILAWVLGREPLPPVLPLANARSLAVTSAIYVDADGDGIVRVPAAAPETPKAR